MITRLLLWWAYKQRSQRRQRQCLSKHYAYHRVSEERTSALLINWNSKQPLPEVFAKFAKPSILLRIKRIKVICWAWEGRKEKKKELNVGGEEELAQLTVNAGRGSSVYEMVVSQHQAILLDRGSPRDKWPKLAALQLTPAPGWCASSGTSLPLPSHQRCRPPHPSTNSSEELSLLKNLSAFFCNDSVNNSERSGKSSSGRAAKAAACDQAQEGEASTPADTDYSLRRRSQTERCSSKLSCQTQKQVKTFPNTTSSILKPAHERDYIRVMCIIQANP